MEARLRDASCALDGGELAATVAAGQAVGWLIDYCKALALANTEIGESDMPPILDALTECRQAYEARNNLIHGESFALGWEIRITRSRRRRAEPEVTEWVLYYTWMVAADLQEAGEDLVLAVRKALRYA